MPQPLRVFLLLPTHTTRHLASALVSIADQTEPPDGVVLTCDTDAQDVLDEATNAWNIAKRRNPDLPPLLITARPSTGEPRLNQVRNNGLRALDHYHTLQNTDLIVIVDGDTVLEPEATAKHRALAATGIDLTIPYRIDLTEQETPDFHQDKLARTGLPDLATYVTDDRTQALSKRHKRYKKQLVYKRLPVINRFIKPHKPKIIGGHHAVSVRVLRAVNGYDELFKGNGTDDDDLTLRIHMLRGSARAQIALAIGDIHAFHLYHVTRRPWRPSEAPDHDRFARKRTTARAEPGWDSPREQPAGTVSVVKGTPQ